MRVTICLSLILVVSGVSRAADEIDFQRDIKPLLAHKCGACHGALKQKAGLRLDTAEQIHRGKRSSVLLKLI